MGTSQGKLHDYWSRVIRNTPLLALSALFTILFSVALARAQTIAKCHCPALNSAPVNLPKVPDDRMVVDKGESPNPGGKQKLCSIEPFPGLANVATVHSLEVPPKAQKQYSDACSALKRNKLAASEQHLRKAVEIYPKYVAGWVMLGQILEAQRQSDRARSACLQASDADPNYVASYLCLAEIAGRKEQWSEVLRYASRALELDSLHDPYAYFFSAIAYFNLNQLPEAETRALKAEVIDKDHCEPLIQFLLARIYEAKHDSVDAASHLQEYQKIVLDSQDSDNVKKDSGKAHNPK